jgi:hypothetical protein
MTINHNDAQTPRKRPSPPQRHSLPAQPEQMYRVEGIGRRGTIRYVKVTGRAGQWRIRGVDGLDVVVRAATVEEALRRARRQIPFRPIVIRQLTSADLRQDSASEERSGTKTDKQ